MSETGRTARLGVDIGGTFTDVALEAAGRRYSAKILTTPEAPERAVLEAIGAVLREAALAPARSVDHHSRHDAGDQRDHRAQGRQDRAPHHRGLPRHDRDPPREPVRAIRRQYRPAAAAGAAPAALSGARAHRRAAAGCSCRSTRRACRSLADRLAAEGVEAVAIGFLHSFTNPAHERRAGEILADAAARASPITLVERRVARDARIRALLDRLRQRLCPAADRRAISPISSAMLRRDGFACPLFLMLSGGGLTTVETAIRFPVRLVESGPAGGAIFAAEIARQCGLDKVLSYDMGGTTAKICLIDDLQAADQPRLRGRAHLPLQEGQRPAVAHPGHRDGRDRRRRRLDRAGRPAEADHRRAGQRRRRPGPGLLWARRQRRRP